MSHSKRRARGQSYYFDAVYQRAKRHLRACSSCGHQGFDPAAVENETNQIVIEELQHLYEPLSLDEAGRCEICRKKFASRVAGA